MAAWRYFQPFTGGLVNGLTEYLLPYASGSDATITPVTTRQSGPEQWAGQLGAQSFTSRTAGQLMRARAALNSFDGFAPVSPASGGVPPDAAQTTPQLTVSQARQGLMDAGRSIRSWLGY